MFCDHISISYSLEFELNIIFHLDLIWIYIHMDQMK